MPNDLATSNFEGGVVNRVEDPDHVTGQLRPRQEVVLPDWQNSRARHLRRLDGIVYAASRRSPILLSWFLLVILPSIGAGVYLSAFASRCYTSEFRATVRSAETRMSGVGALFGLAGTTQSATDANAVIQYLQSRDALEQLDKRLSVRHKYAAEGIDWFSRLNPDTSIEGFVRYWERHLEAFYETTTGTIIVRVTAFRPEDALAITSASLALSEDLVNNMSARALNDGVRFAEAKVAEAEARLVAANQRLRLIQDKERMLDPRKTAATALSLSAKLQEQVSALNAALAVERTYMTDESPIIKVAKAQIAALQVEIEKINASTTAVPNGPEKPLSGIIGAFDEIEAERGFAQKNYEGTLAALEAARLEATRQRVYLATIVKPELPQEPSFPRPVANTLTIFGIAFLSWGIGILGVFAVKEHM